MATYSEIESVIFTEARFYGGLSELDPEDALDLIKDAAEQCGAYNEYTDEVAYSETSKVGVTSSKCLSTTSPASSWSEKYDLLSDPRLHLPLCRPSTRR